MDLFDSIFGILEENVEFGLRKSVLIVWADYSTRVNCEAVIF
jgi:hypothetical protein